jgi:hypothetical protein
VLVVSSTRYPGGRNQEDLGSKPAWANSLWDPISKKTYHKKGLVEWLKVKALSSSSSNTKKKKKKKSLGKNVELFLCNIFFLSRIYIWWNENVLNSVSLDKWKHPWKIYTAMSRMVLIPGERSSLSWGTCTLLVTSFTTTVLPISNITQQSRNRHFLVFTFAQMNASKSFFLLLSYIPRKYSVYLVSY